MANSFKNMVRAGFATGLGVFGAVAVYMLIGIIFFLPGYSMYMSEKKAGDTGSTKQVAGIILMGIGVVIMGGAGLGFLVDAAGDLF
jgi:hypothetical protein